MDVIAIIVTYRRPEGLRASVEAIRRQTRPPTRIIVVDNHPAATPAELRGAHDITYLPSAENLGPAGGIAAGMRHAIGEADDDDWIVLIDDDDLPPSDAMLERLLACAGTERARGAPVAAVGMVGTRFDLRRARAMRVPDAELQRTVVDVDWIAGGQLPVYSVGVLRQVGVFDESLFFGFEELEFGLRLRAAGERLVVPGSVAFGLREAHGRLGLGTRVPSAGGVAWRRYYSTRNLILIMRRYSSRRGVLHAVLRAGVGGAIRSLLVLRRPDLFTAALHGALDGLRGRTGRTIPPKAA